MFENLLFAVEQPIFIWLFFNSKIISFVAVIQLLEKPSQFMFVWLTVQEYYGLGVFPPPPAAAQLMQILPPPHCFNGPFVSVDLLMESLRKFSQGGR